MPFEDRPSRPPRPTFDDSFPPPDMGGAPGGEPVKATVKWFKADKGFGFVELANGGGDAFLHINVLQSTGYDTVAPGTTLKVIAGRGMKGLQVSTVLEVDTSTAEARPPRSFEGGGASPARGGPRHSAADPSTATELNGQVKWFDATKGFGFIAAEDGGKDIFVHVSTLRNAGLATLDENQAVLVKVVETPKGREAIAVSAR